MKVKSVMLMLGIIAYSFSVNAQNKETQCEQFYKDAKSAYEKGDYEVALIFFNRCKAEGCKNADFQIYIDVCNMKLKKKNSIDTINNGVEINGVVWATCNIDVPGKFTAKPENYGQYYTWKESQNVCPTGWRLPTNKEVNSLLNSSTSIWSKMNNINGCYWGSGNNRVFVPAAGYRNALRRDDVSMAGSTGRYWMSDNAFWFDSNDSKIHYNYDNVKNRYSVRCVKE